MVNKTKVIIGLLLSVSLTACSTTTKYVYVEPEPFAFQKTTEPKERIIRVHKEDVPLYQAYIDKLRGQIRFHNSQIDDYLNSFKKKGSEGGIR